MKKAYKILVTIFQYIITIFLISFSTIIFLIAFTKIVFPNKFLSLVGYDIYLASNTGSMEPSIKTNDLMIIKKYDFYDLKPGDVISFKVFTIEGTYFIVTHEIQREIVGTTGQIAYVTKGTNVDKEDLNVVTIDGALNSNLYVGKLIGTNRILGNIISFVTNPVGFISILLNSLLIIFIVYELKKAYKANKLDLLNAPKPKKTIIEGYSLKSPILTVENKTNCKASLIGFTNTYKEEKEEVRKYEIEVKSSNFIDPELNK